MSRVFLKTHSVQFLEINCFRLKKNLLMKKVKQQQQQTFSRESFSHPGRTSTNDPDAGLWKLRLSGSWKEPSDQSSLQRHQVLILEAFLSLGISAKIVLGLFRRTSPCSSCSACLDLHGCEISISQLLHALFSPFFLICPHGGSK